MDRCRAVSKCHDCHVTVHCVHPEHDSEDFMVHDKLWPDGVRFLCIGCLETRLGRQLVATDFIDCPLNDPDIELYGERVWTWRSPRLQDRLTGVQVTPWRPNVDRY
jgi:hypothetical protein